MAAVDQDAERKLLLERLSTLETPSLQRLATLAGVAPEGENAPSVYLDHLQAAALGDVDANVRNVAASDVAGLKNAERSYGPSWKLRGGIDTFHMLQRKWERVEGRLKTRVLASTTQAAASPYDVFEHIAADPHTHGLIDDIRDLRRYLMLVEAEVSARAALAPNQTPDNSSRDFLRYLSPIASADVDTVQAKERAYGDSWKRNGGIGTFMIFARKWDRIKMRVTSEQPGAARDNILEHIAADRRSEPVLDDVRDLRQFLLLVEAEMAARNVVAVGSARDDNESP